MNTLCIVCKKAIGVVKEGKELKVTADGAVCRSVKYKRTKKGARLFFCSPACSSSYDALKPEDADKLLSGKDVVRAAPFQSPVEVEVKVEPEVDTEPNAE